MLKQRYRFIVIIYCLFLCVITGCQRTSSTLRPSEKGTITGKTSALEQASPDSELTQKAPKIDASLAVQSENIPIKTQMDTPSVRNIPGESEAISIDGLLAQCVIHRVEPGETVSKIGKKYKIAEGFITRFNHISNPNLIRIGQKLKVIEGPFQVLIRKEDKTLRLYLNSTLIKTYDVAIGKNDSTPEGHFTVRKKLIKPVWTDPYNRIQVKPDDPSYPLGTRWIEFADHGYGIHGTNDPDSIKKEASFGCIRMLNTDVEELYDFLVVGSSVDILAKNSDS